MNYKQVMVRHISGSTKTTQFMEQQSQSILHKLLVIIQ